MKLSIDWSEGVNARVLDGIITELDAEKNTATVIVNSKTIVDVPIHYWCHHGVDNHGASRVFVNGDMVRIIYTGMGAVLDKDNLIVMGLKNQIRRCRTAYGCQLSLGSGTVIPVEYAWIIGGKTTGVTGYEPSSILPKFLFNSQGETVYPDTSAAGDCDWISTTHSVSWSWSKSRYVMAGTDNKLFMDGTLWGTAPASVLGAGIYNNKMIVALSNGKIYDRPLNKNSEWRALAGIFPINLKQGCFFNADCSKAISLTDDFKILDISIYSDYITYTQNSTYQDNATIFTNESGDDFSETSSIKTITATIAVDYDGLEKKQLNYTFYTKTTNLTKYVYETPTDGTATYIKKTTSTDVTEQNTSISGALTIDLNKYNFYTTKVIDVSDDRRKNYSIENFTDNRMYSIITHCDLRYGLSSFFSSEFSILGEQNMTLEMDAHGNFVVVSETTNCTGNCTTSKKFNGTEVSSNIYGLLYYGNDRSPSGVSSASNPDTDPIQFPSNVNLLNVLSIVPPIDLIFDYSAKGYGLPISAQARDGSYYRSWLYDKNKPPAVIQNGSIIPPDSGVAVQAKVI